MRKLTFTLSSLLLIAGCSGEPATTAPRQESQAIAANWMNNPDNGNFRIYRSQGDLSACWTDPATGLRACHATFPLADPDCGQGTAGPADYQQLLIDVDAFRVAANAVGKVFITVRDLNNAGACFGAELVAEGWGSMRYTDNDQFFSVVNNKNTWGFMASGNLTTPAGAAVRYNGHFRAVADLDTYRDNSQVVVR